MRSAIFNSVVGRVVIVLLDPMWVEACAVIGMLLHFAPFCLSAPKLARLWRHWSHNLDGKTLPRACRCYFCCEKVTQICMS